jgi:hypothetical protein
VIERKVINKGVTSLSQSGIVTQVDGLQAPKNKMLRFNKVGAKLGLGRASGGDAQARAVQGLSEGVRAVAAAACPQNAEVHVAGVMADVRLGDDERARAAFDRVLTRGGRSRA